MLDEVIKQNFGDKIYNGTSGNVIIFLSSLTFESRKHPYPAQCSSEKNIRLNQPDLKFVKTMK